MEPLDNTNTPHSNLPSKRFLIRGGIATLIVALVLLAQTSWVRGIFGRKEKGLSIDPNQTIRQVVGKDSNGNGISDWEEQLWGLDPTKLTTDGVANKSIIEQKRRSLQTNEDGGPLNETDRLARELFSVTTALSQGGAGRTLSQVGGSIGENMPEPQTAPHYSREDLRLVTTSGRALITYRRGLEKALASYSATLPEIEVVIQTLETGNTDQLDALNKTIAFYQSLNSQLISLSVPRSVAQYHLDMVNSTYGLAEAFKKMKVLDDNGIQALVGLAEYRTFSAQLDTAAQNLTTFLNEYDIL